MLGVDDALRYTTLPSRDRDSAVTLDPIRDKDLAYSGMSAPMSFRAIGHVGIPCPTLYIKGKLGTRMEESHMGVCGRIYIS